MRVSTKSSFCLRLVIMSFRDLSMLSDAESAQHLELLDPGKTGKWKQVSFSAAGNKFCLLNKRRNCIYLVLSQKNPCNWRFVLAAKVGDGNLCICLIVLVVLFPEKLKANLSHLLSIGHRLCLEPVKAQKINICLLTLITGRYSKQIFSLWRQQNMSTVFWVSQ